LRVLPVKLTSDLDHPILGLHGQFLGGEVVDVEGDPPAVGGVLDLRYAPAQLPAERPAVGLGGRRGDQGRGGGSGRDLLGHGAGQQAHVARPAGVAGPLVPVLRQAGQPEGLVEEAAAGRVPVPERVPAGASLKGEGDSSLRHVE
uniref:Uncharacterized protein n=1 Tax=Sarcophilus harrisii TaxID=9305 RepID=A0A7N4PKX0_SARHA